MEELLVKYGLIFGKRFTLKQRRNFLVVISEEFGKLGYATKFANDDRKSNAKSVDLFVGDIGKASTIICTHYDTPLKSLIPNYRYYPLDGQRSHRIFLLATFLPTLIVTMLGIAIMIYIVNIPNFEGFWYNVYLFSTIFLTFMISAIISRGFRNKYNINKNTASILAMLVAAESLNKQSRSKVAFILLDKGCTNHNGAQMLAQALPTTLDKKLFIYLDCIGRGDNLVIGHRENLRMESDKILKFFSGKQSTSTYELDAKDVMYTPLYYLKRSLVISNGQKDKTGSHYVDKTSSSADKYADIETIQFVGKMLAESLNK